MSGSGICICMLSGTRRRKKRDICRDLFKYFLPLRTIAVEKLAIMIILVYDITT